jgi:hypothetical protein
MFRRHLLPDAINGVRANASPAVWQVHAAGKFKAHRRQNCQGYDLNLKLKC